MLTTDFMRDVVGKAVPYGVYDLAQNERYVVVGRSHETPAFAVAAIRSWWLDAGRQAYPGSHQLLIEADSGGADGDRNLRWKISLQALANEFDLTITVTHYPTSASKWNPVKHCLFGLISGNWAVQSLCSFETVLKFIRATRTETELHCRARPDTRECATGLQVTKEQKAQVHFGRRCILPKYNYTIQPQTDVP